MNPKLVETFLNHIILPRVLPDEKQQYLDELELIAQLVETVDNLSKWLPAETVELFWSLRRVHSQSHCVPNIIANEINQLRPNDSFAMFIERQNCAFFIHMPLDESLNDERSRNVIVATFPGSLSPSEIYSDSNDDVEFNYPVQAFKVQFSRMLRSEDFAHQLSMLNDQLPIETKYRDYLSKWLLTVLMDESSRTAYANEFPVIKKKIRSELVGNDWSHFCRSRFYISTKVILQLCLTIHMGAELGKFHYKIAMLAFMVRMCEIYMESDYVSFNIDLMSQMMSKMARRIEKLSDAKPETIPGKTSNFYEQTIYSVKQSIQLIRCKIDEQIQTIQQADVEASQLSPMTGLNFELDICQKMKKLREHLNDRNKATVTGDKLLDFEIISYQRYFKNIQKYPNVEMFRNKTDGIPENRIFWMDFENRMLYTISLDKSPWTPNELRSWLFEYASYVRCNYDGNPLLLSRMLLVRLKIIAILDKLAAKQHLIFKEHHTGVEPEVFECLLLPHKMDMNIGYELENYFKQRNRSATYPSLLAELSPGRQSFSVRLAKKHPDMINVRKEILILDEQNIVRKELEWTDTRDEVEQLRTEARSMDCDTDLCFKKKPCQKCSLIRKADKIKVLQYERLLPTCEDEQFAVVFELKIPTAIVCLRDILSDFADLFQTNFDSLAIKENWVDSRISTYNKSISKTVALGSSVKPAMQKLHVDNTFDRFIVNNTFNCVLHANKKRIPKPVSAQVLKKFLTFKTTGEYTGSQWTLNSTLHTQNQVLSRQSECPHDLTLAEYVSFGSLRADGHRLQLRKLYVMIETQALSFDKESVLMLIMQTLWECGVSGDAEAIRESHFDLNEPVFCSGMIETLNKFIEQQRYNWIHPLKLLMATLIAIRAFEMNDSEKLALEVCKLLRTIRAIAKEWITKIEQSIKELRDEKTSRELRVKIIYTSIAGGLTFYAHPTHKYCANILANEGITAAQFWLYFIVTLKNNIHLYVNDERYLPLNIQIFLRLIESTGVYLESRLFEIIRSNQNQTQELIQKLWPRAMSASALSSDFHAKFTHILILKAVIDSKRYTVTTDIISGLFLVNGSPVSRLPNDITQDELFQWFFGKAIMEVQPDGRNSYHTVQKYNDCVYEFARVNNRLSVIERKSNGTEKELLHYKVLSGDFPILLVKNYSHWWNKSNNCIEFRLKASKEKHFSTETDTNYRLDLKSRHLIHLKTQRPMFDVSSHCHTEIVRRLSRLEHSDQIHVLLEDKKIACAELVRMKLKFRVDCSSEVVKQEYFLESNEFSGMRVSCRQKIGTLFGLNNGLVLESSCRQDIVQTRTLLLPHGKIRTSCSGSHVSVNIDTENGIRNPPFYEYEVDSFCQQLKASDRSHTSWFYLAYLHAVTSHGEIEPFTGISGTERALQILQSAFAWSSSPYERDAVEILKEIANLTPVRSFGNINGRVQHIQKITWPPNIPRRSAQDSFVFIVKKLLDDSERLRNLYLKNIPEVAFNFKTDMLNIRDYNRTIQLQPNLRVSDTIIQDKIKNTSLSVTPPTSFSSSTASVTVLYHKQGLKVPSDLDLKRFLTKSSHLKGITSAESVEQILNHNSYDTFSDVWIGLYDAFRKQLFNHEQITLMLTLFAHQNAESGAILALQAVARHPHLFHQINPPSVQTFNISAGSYSESTISTSLKNFYTVPYDYKNWDEQQRNDHDSEYKSIVDRITKGVTRKRACDSVKVDCDFAAIDFKAANTTINQFLLSWNNNIRLKDFIDDVTRCLNSLKSTGFHLPNTVPLTTPPARNRSKNKIDVNAKINKNLIELQNHVIEARQIWEQNDVKLLKAPKDWKSIVERMFHSEETKHLTQAGLLPRTIPSVLLPKIIGNNTDHRVKALIGCWALAIVREQREKRIEIYSQQPELKHAVDKEIDNEPHVNWTPCKYPEWLLFEIEQNLTIRRIQVEIAKRMIEPPKKNGVNHKHSVMQLNMGEGKTAVIVPILAAILADGKQLCQITVLKPLFSRNLKFLRQNLGGFLNRRFYTFPCRRDMPIDHYVNQILSMYVECQQSKGVILTLPEYRLSFQLKIYDSMQKKDFEAANNFLKVHHWINANVRNIMDESDAILQANYQMIYTVGKQLQPDGGPKRWIVPQALFKRIPIHMKELYRKHGKEKIEFDENYVKSGNVYGAPMVDHRADVFTPCRILDDSLFDELRLSLIDDFLENRLDISIPIVGSEKERLRKFLIQEDVDEKLSEMVKRMQLNEQQIIMILCGLLRFEILKLTLRKRWRVHYGVDENKKEERRMAIPFKAKDIAAESVEFGHLDVAICFTQISYYYSGLSDDQLHQLFEKLKSEPNASAIYEKWIESICRDLVDSTIVSYSGVNLHDPHQRENLLFPVLRFNMNVIDYWLSKFVFPREARVFKNKLMCTVWDLCSDQLDYRVTGFSGTNDTQNILPLTVVQNDLDELENTNTEMRAVLLRPENQLYEHLPANVSGMEILERLTERKIPVLLDSGALILELTNKQVANKWLEMTPEESFDAAVYFDSGDVLQTIDRNGLVTDFDCSVYRANLNRCLVYLDDVHTRGTDLKFPQNWTACVTLSGDITRDKTVQSCMRMRQLGKSHSIRFWASYEADVRIRKICKLSVREQVNNKHVNDFVEENSKHFETLNMTHWSAGAMNYTKKLVGHILYGTADGSDSIQKMYDVCVEDEFVELRDMYDMKVQKPLVEIVDEKFSKMRRKYILQSEVRPIIQRMLDNVVDKVIKQAPEMKQFSSAIDEEQEKEQEKEIQQHRHVQRPPFQIAAEPVLNEKLQWIVLNGATDDMIEEMNVERLLLSITESLSHTTMFELCENNENAWAEHLFVTKDFRTVLRSSSKACDKYLRPIWWAARINKSNGDALLVLLSSFECDRLLPSFRKSVNAQLFMYRPRLAKLHSNLLHETKLQVTGMRETSKLKVQDEVQIGMYAGSMYFESEAEQNAYCGFLGLIPNPRTKEQQMAATKGMVVPTNGFVYLDNRCCNQSILNCVGHCKFIDCPIDLAIKLIEAHHHRLIEESHVASILERCTKLPIETVTDK